MTRGAPNPASPPAAAALTGVLFFVLYAATAAREPIFGDGLEFVAAAASGGIPHPTGYPLFTAILGALGSSSYFASAIVCAMIAAMAAAVVSWIVRASWEYASPGRGAAFAITAGLFAGASASLWRSGTLVEVYGLNALLSAGTVALLLPRACGASWRLPAASLCFGLAMTNHLSSAGLAIPLAWAVVRESLASHRAGRTRSGVLLIAGCAAALCAGLLPWLRLPLRAAHDPAINWGDPETMEGFLWMVRGGDYRATRMFMAAPDKAFTVGTWLAFAAHRVAYLVSSAGAEFLGGGHALGRGAGFAASLLLGTGLTAATALGARTLWSSQRGLAASLAGAAAFQAFLIFAYNIADISDYFLGLFVVLLPFTAAGLARLPLDAKRPAVRVAIPAALFVALLANFGTASYRSETAARKWIDRVCEALPQDAILITQGDYDIYAMWYAQLVENKRPDVLVAGPNFLRYEWYATMLPKEGEDPAGRFVQARRMAVPRDPVQFVQRIESAILGHNLDRVPVVITDGDPLVLQVLAKTYRLEPLAHALTEEEMLAAADRLPVLPPRTLYRVSAPTSGAPPSP